MDVLLSNNVEQSLYAYLQSLLDYPISVERAYQKYERMRNFVLGIGNNPYAYPICRYKNLGQQFDTNNRPLNPNLHQVVYKDESKRPWTFAFWIDEEYHQVVVTRMIFSSYIKEEIEHPTLLQRVVEKVLKEYGLL